MKVELIRADVISELEKNINEFIRDKDVVNVTISHNGSDYYGYLACILYLN